ncbi:MAG: ABC transporter permease [Desulfobulbaceae bacterium]|nr:ABC transporter permease [Desulfobulbaceae bacterium]
MRLNDFFLITFLSVREQPLRSFLTALGIAVGISAVVLLTSLGEGLHRFVLSEFTQFGTNLIAINPGKKSTLGVSGAVISNVRPLSIDDADALSMLPGVIKSQPVIQGNAAVEAGKRQRRTTVFGVGSDTPEVWQLSVAAGHFLPNDPPRNARPYAVLGSRLRKELFKQEPFLGKRLRIGGEVYRVIGGMESKGQMLGFDLDDAVYLPIAKAMSMFNRESLMEIDLLYDKDHSAESITIAASKMLKKRHGSEDFTITTQEQMLETLGSVLNILTIAVGALGGISLVVGGVGIFTIMTIAVNERRAEIGLLCALGASRQLVRLLFLGEAITLSLLGGLAGLILGVGCALGLALLVPALPIHTSWGFVAAAELIAVLVGLGAGVLPANNAASLPPVEALRAE